MYSGCTSHIILLKEVALAQVNPHSWITDESPVLSVWELHELRGREANVQMSDANTGSCARGAARRLSPPLGCGGRCVKEDDHRDDATAATIQLARRCAVRQHHIEVGKLGRGLPAPLRAQEAHAPP
jgi:hypothetical protein